MEISARRSVCCSAGYPTAPGPDLIRLAFDMGGDLADAQSNLAEVRGEIVDGQLIRTIVERGVRRGEVDPERLTPRIISLPGDLARNELLMTLKPLRDEVIREIVHDIFLPLVCQTHLSIAPQ